MNKFNTNNDNYNYYWHIDKIDFVDFDYVKKINCS